MKEVQGWRSGPGAGVPVSAVLFLSFEIGEAPEGAAAGP